MIFGNDAPHSKKDILQLKIDLEKKFQNIRNKRDSINQFIEKLSEYLNEKANNLLKPIETGKKKILNTPNDSILQILLGIKIIQNQVIEKILDSVILISEEYIFYIFFFFIFSKNSPKTLLLNKKVAWMKS